MKVNVHISLITVHKCLLDISINELSGIILSEDNIIEFLKRRKESKEKEIMKECEKRKASKDNLEICQKCKKGEMIWFIHRPQLPNNCPRHDELEKQFEDFKKSSEDIEKTKISLEQIDEQLYTAQRGFSQTELKLLYQLKECEDKLEKSKKKM